MGHSSLGSMLVTLVLLVTPLHAQEQSEFFSPVPEGDDSLFFSAPATETTQAPVQLTVPTRSRELFGQLAVRYREALEELGTTDRDELIDRVVTLEVEAMGKNPERRVPRLAQMELAVADELARHDPEMLVPVFQLHHDLYLAHRRAKNWYLLHHQTAMVNDLTALYIEATGTPGAKMVAARTLASLGGYMQAARQTLSASLFDLALTYDPNNEASLLGMVAHYEKYGGPYAEVRRQLDRLLAVYPDHREGRLRQGINLFRLERDKEGEAALKSLLEEETTDWIYCLAAQELARHYANNEQLPKAIETLEQARRRAPGDQKLAIQLSYLYDVGRRSWDAGKLAREVRTRVEENATLNLPPRGLYNMWPSAAVQEDRRHMRELATSREGLLAETLSRIWPDEAPANDTNPGAPATPGAEADGASQ